MRNEPPRRIDDVQPGFFRIRLCRNGPYVAARIERTEHGWKASIQGESCGFANPDPWASDGVSRIWHFGVMISEAEYRQLLGSKHPSPHKPIDMNSEAPPF